MDTSLFFPERYQAVSTEVVAICESCPVHEQCFDWAVHHELHGYWAGTSAKRREVIRKTLNITIKTPQSSFYW
jgi:hypothetical protein